MSLILKEDNNDNVYINNTKDGIGKNISLNTIDVSKNVRLCLKATYIEKKDDIQYLRLIKQKLKGKTWEDDQKLTLSKFNINKINEFLSILNELELKELSQNRISLKALHSISDLTIDKLKRLLDTAPGAELLKEVISNSDSLSSKDIVSTAYRKKQLKVFEGLLYDKNYLEQYKIDNDLIDRRCGEENVWQHYFENNKWIFGYGLNYICCTSLDEDSKLEQVIKGYDFSSRGKTVDALMKTNAAISQSILVEIKKPSDRLISKQERGGCWSICNSVNDAIAQIQKTAY